MKKIKINPKSIIKTALTSAVTACAVSNGLTKEQAQMAADITGSVVDSVEFEKKPLTPAQEIESVASKAVQRVFDNNDIPESCQAALMNFFNVENTMLYLGQDGLETSFVEMVKRGCGDDCDFDTLEIETYVKSVLDGISKAILSSPQLLSAATYARTVQTQEVVHDIRTTVQEIARNQSLQMQPVQPIGMPQPQNSLAEKTKEKLIESFAEVMFLHKNKEAPDVTLANLYVDPRFEEDDDESRELPARVGQFLTEEDTELLFLVGDGGSGKSTFVSWLCYHEKDEEVREILGNRELLVLRLRDLDKVKVTSAEELLNCIKASIGCENMDDESFADRMNHCFLILDGYDEFCIGGNIGHARLLQEFSDRISGQNLKILITTRPSHLATNTNRLELQHFNSEQRKEWLDNYQKKCHQNVAVHVQAFIKGTHESTFDTPLVLYMACAGTLTAEELQNSWKIYHKIFYQTIKETKYTPKVEPFSNAHHPAQNDWDCYYRINEEIAYRLFVTGNKREYITAEELNDIIACLQTEFPELEDKNHAELIKHCYALCGYWKTGTDGMLEFYHNNIRDFFLCEKLFREINQLYKGDWDDENAIKVLAKLLQYGDLPALPVELMKARSEWGKKEVCKDDFPKMEKECAHLPRFMQRLCTNGSILFEVKAQKGAASAICSANPIRGMANCIYNIVRIFVQTLLPYRNEDERITLFTDIQQVNDVKFFNQILMIDSEEKVDLPFVNLSNANLSVANLRGANLTDAYLTGADLNVAHLRGANLIDANLIGATLIRANLIRADLTDATLIHAHLRDADLRGANLRGADLRDADLRGANLRGADLRGADLRGAHLVGVDLTRAYLTDADLRGANLRGAHLTDANMTNVTR